MSKIEDWLNKQNKYLRAAVVTAIIAGTAFLFCGYLILMISGPAPLGLIMLVLALIAGIYYTVLED